MGASLFRPKVFLDLEMTIIDNFQNGRLVNVEQVRRLLPPDTRVIGIFSFAIFNDKDASDCILRLVPTIERALNVKVGLVVTIREMMQADYAYTGCRFDPDNGCDVTDWLSIRGKVDGFRYWVLNQAFDDEHYTLLDDVVPNISWQYRDQNITIQYKHISPE